MNKEEKVGCHVDPRKNPREMAYRARMTGLQRCGDLVVGLGAADSQTEQLTRAAGSSLDHHQAPGTTGKSLFLASTFL